jgi:hypothetical protein
MLGLFAFYILRLSYTEISPGVKTNDIGDKLIKRVSKKQEPCNNLANSGSKDSDLAKKFVLL